MSADASPDARPDAPAVDAAADAAPDAAQEDAPADTNASDVEAPTCPAGQRPCVCATGYYCLRIGAACLVPTAPCPG